MNIKYSKAMAFCKVIYNEQQITVGL